MDDNNAKFQEEMNRIRAALSDVGVAIREFVTAAAPLIQELANIIVPYALEFRSYSPRRVVHLAKHARKYRTRKKNVNRMIKESIKREGRKQ